MKENLFVKAGRRGALARWGEKRGRSKQIRVYAETADRVHAELLEKDRVAVLSEIIEEALDLRKKSGKV